MPAAPASAWSAGTTSTSRVAPVGQHLQVFGAHQPGHDADIGLSLGHGTHDVVAQPFLQVHIHIRVRQQVAPPSTGGRNSPSAVVLANTRTVPFDATRVLPQVGAQMLQLAQHQPGMVHKGLPGRGSASRPARAVKQLDARLSSIFLIRVLAAGADM